ncbi:hypothetical protein EZV62_001534 [Acer yangbiense]|uniref:MLO-like protein n=1 Tax=Acer yangbiense TaxID=1000413 RepID=A0A5C7IUT1_9ROSI|nr:hypothetical protein EZV62_001534 [Acer yangbiense]
MEAAVVGADVLERRVNGRGSGELRRGNLLKRKNQKPLFEALQKIKEELMLLGFISLLLTVCQNTIAKICIPQHLSTKWMPCKKQQDNETKTTSYFFSFVSADGILRHLLAEASSSSSSSSSSQDYCSQKGEVALLSTTALHHLHIFIFVLAVAHVTFCALTILFGGAKIRQWKHWEESVSKDKFDAQEFTRIQDHDFIKNRFRGVGTSFGLQSFCKQFYGSVTKTDYTTLRLGFIMTHCRGNPKFDFHKYMMRVLEADFKKVVGKRLLLLAVGTKLEHVITQLAHEVAEKHVAIEGDLVVKPSDDHFWFKRPCLILLFTSFYSKILSNSLFSSGFGVFVQFLCSYSTLQLYAIVTQMGSSFKKQVFDEHIQEGLVGWAKQAKKNTVLRKDAAANGNRNGSSSQVSHKEDSPLMALQLPTLVGDKGSSAMEGEILPDK